MALAKVLHGKRLSLLLKSEDHCLRPKIAARAEAVDQLRLRGLKA